MRYLWWTYWIQRGLHHKGSSVSTVHTLTISLWRIWHESAGVWKISLLSTTRPIVINSSRRTVCQSWVGTMTLMILSWWSLSQAWSWSPRSMMSGLSSFSLALKTSGTSTIRTKSVKVFSYSGNRSDKKRDRKRKQWRKNVNFRKSQERREIDVHVNES